MGKINKKEIAVKAKVATDNTTTIYINDPYFVKKREIGNAFLKKVGLPESFKKYQGK